MDVKGQLFAWIVINLMEKEEKSGRYKRQTWMWNSGQIEHILMCWFGEF